MHTFKFGPSMSSTHPMIEPGIGSGLLVSMVDSFHRTCRFISRFFNFTKPIILSCLVTSHSKKPLSGARQIKSSSMFKNTETKIFILIKQFQFKFPCSSLRFSPNIMYVACYCSYRGEK